MSGIFRKLNTLVSARINDALASTTGGARRINLRRDKVAREVATIRERLDKAMASEQALVDRADAIGLEVDRLDNEADEAVKRGDDDTARQLVARLRREQRRHEMAAATLESHRLATADLMRQVNPY